MTVIENFLANHGFEGGSSTEPPTVIPVDLETRLQSLEQYIQDLRQEVAAQALTDERHDEHMVTAEKTAKDIEEILDNINGTRN